MIKDIREQVDEIIANLLEDLVFEDDTISKDDEMLLGLNSFQFIGFVVELENHFDIEFEEEMLRLGSFSSIDDICEYIQYRKEQDQ